MALGVVLLGKDPPTASIGTACVGIDDDKAAILQRCDLRLVLGGTALFVDTELGRERGSVRRQETGIDPITRTVLTRRSPDRHKRAAGQGRKRGVVLGSCGGGIDRELGRARRVAAKAVGREDPAEDTGAVAVAGRGRVGRIPQDREPAPRQRGHRRFVLGRTGLLVHAEIAGQGRPCRAVEDPGIDVIAAGTAKRMPEAGPGDQDAAVAEHGDIRLVLRTGRVVIDPRLGPKRRAIGGKALHEDALSAGVLTRPGDDKAAARDPGHMGVKLVVGGGGVDGKFSAHRVAVEVEALTEHTPGARLILGKGFPDHDEAAVDGRHIGVLLGARDKGVCLAFAKIGHGPVQRRGNGQGHQRRIRGLPRAIPDLHPQDAAFIGIVRDVAIGQVLDQKFDDGRRGIAVQGDQKGLAAGSRRRDRADRDTVHLHIRAKDGDPPGLQQPDLILVDVVGRKILRQVLGTAFQHIDAHKAAVPARPAVVHHHRRAVQVDPLRRGIHHRLGHGAGRVDGIEFRLPGAAKDRRFAEDPLEDVRAAGPGPFPVHKDPVGQRGDAGGMLASGNRLVDDLLPVQTMARGIVDLDEGAVAAVVLRCPAGREGHRKATRCQCRDMRLVVGAQGRLVHQELVTDGVAGGIVHPAEHTIAGTVRAVLVFPDHDKAAAGQACNLAGALVALGCRIHLEFRADRDACRIEALAEDAVGVDRILRIAGPGHHPAAARQGRNRRFQLCAGAEAVDLEFSPDRCAALVVKPGTNPVARRIAVGIAPDRHEGACLAGCQRHLVFGARDHVIQPELCPLGRAVGCEDPGKDPGRVAGAIAVPRDDETAVRKADNRRVALRAGDSRVNKEFRSDRLAEGVEPLGIDAVAAVQFEILVRGLPDRDIAAPRQGGACGQRLGVDACAVDLKFVRTRAGCIHFGRDLDGQHPDGRAAVAIRQHDAQGARGLGVVRGVRIAQRIQQGLDPFRRGCGVEGDGQCIAILPVVGQRSDDGAIDADGCARDRHAPRRERQDILALVVRCQELVGNRREGWPGDLQPAAVEIGTVGIRDHAAPGNQKDRPGVDRAFGQGDRGGQAVQHRRRGTGRQDAIAQYAQEDPVAGPVAGTARGVRGPDHGNPPVGKCDNGGLVLCAFDPFIDAERPVDLGSVCGILLAEDAVG